MENKEPEFWSCDDDAENHFTEIDDAIEYCLSNENITEGKLIVFGYDKEVITPTMCTFLHVLDNFIESLDEEYGPRYGSTKPTEKMKQAEQAFIETVLNEYTVYQLRLVETRTIDIATWIKTNNPDWLTT